MVSLICEIWQEKKINKMRRQPLKLEKIFPNHLFDKRLISKMYKEFIKLNTKIKIIQFKSGQKYWIDIFPKKTYKWPTGKGKGAQHHWSSEKCKSKPHWDITSHLLEWLSSKRQEITSVGKEVEKKESFFTVGGKVNWGGHCGKQYGRVLKKLKIQLP